VWHHHVTHHRLRNTVFAHEVTGVGMFTRKLGRVARLVLVLAVAFGGVGVAAAAGEAHVTHNAAVFTTLITDWE